MKKRIFVLLFAFVLCLTLIGCSANSGQKILETDESNTSLNKVDQSLIHSVQGDSVYLEWVMEFPEETLSASTATLLTAFLDSRYVQQLIFSQSSPGDSNIDFSGHPAYEELISREDCAEAIRAYGEYLDNQADASVADTEAYSMLLMQAQIQQILA